MRILLPYTVLGIMGGVLGAAFNRFYEKVRRTHRKDGDKEVQRGGVGTSHRADSSARAYQSTAI